MKVNKVILNIFVILLIILIIAVSFLGINVKKNNIFKNILPEFKYGMDFKGNRNVRFVVDESEVTKDEETTELEEVKTEGETEEVSEEKQEEVKELVNPTEIRTADSYKKTRDIIEKRLQYFKQEQYTVKLNEQTGMMDIELLENEDVTTVIQNLLKQGSLNLIDSETNEVLLSNENIKQAVVGYGDTENGRIVGLIIKYNDDCKEKLKEITTNHAVSKDEEGNDNSKKVKLMLDDEVILETAYEEPVETGELSMSVGQATNNTTTLNQNVEAANELAAIINLGKTPIKYSLDINRYMSSDVEMDLIDKNIYIAVAVIITLLILAIVAVNLNLGVKNAILFIGFIATYLLVMRYTDVVITLEGIVASLFIIGLQFVFMLRTAMKQKDSKDNVVINEIKRNALRLLPLGVLLIVCIYSNWQSLFSVGVLMFWGLVVMLVYNCIFTNILYNNSKK